MEGRVQRGHAAVVELKRLRLQKEAARKERDAASSALEARQWDWVKAHEQHMRVEDTAKGLCSKLEAIEKEKEQLRRRVQQLKAEAERCSSSYVELKRELDIVEVTAAAAGSGKVVE